MDVLHIVRVALDRPELASGAYEVLSRIDAPKRGGWARFISYELDVHARDAAHLAPQSQRLTICAQQWTIRSEAISGFVGVTCSLILSTILTNEPSLARMAQYCDINYSWLVQALESRIPYMEGPAVGGLGVAGGFGSAGGPGAAGGYVGQIERWPNSTGYGDVVPSLIPPLAPPAPGFGGMPGDPRAYLPSPTFVPDGKFGGQSLLARFEDPIAPSPTRVFAGLHTDVALRLATYLSEHARSRGMFVLAGRSGTPIQVIGQVLADRHAPASGPTPVRAIHLGDLLSESKRDASATDYLARILREAASQSIILLLYELELLRGDSVDSGTKDLIIEELGSSTGVPIIGLYQLDEEETYHHDQVRLGIANATTLEVEASTERETLALLRESFLPDWQNQGYSFHEKEKTFDWVFKLAPYLRVETRQLGAIQAERKCLPYAVIDVGRELIAMLSADPNKQVSYGNGFNQEYETTRVKNTIHVLATAADTQILHLSAVESLLPAEIQDILHKADEEIRKLAKDPAPHFKARAQHTQLELTRAHLMAQLFYPTGTRFQALPRLPEGVAQPSQHDHSFNGNLP